MTKTDFNKEEFLNSMFGEGLIECIREWDKQLCMKAQFNEFTPEYRASDYQAHGYECQWYVYKKFFRSIGLRYNFTRTDEYFGVCSDDETDWLIKFDRSVIDVYSRLKKVVMYRPL